MANKLNDLTGKTFGSLYVIERFISKLSETLLDLQV